MENRQLNRPLYKYDRSGHWYFIYKMTYIGLSSYGEKISEPLTKEEAEIETYKLNNWKLNENRS